MRHSRTTAQRSPLVTRLALAAALAVMVACGGDSTTAPRTLTTITIAPNPVTMVPGTTQQFTATGKDAGGNVLAINPTWTVSNNGGTIDANGLFTAGSTTGSYTVTATNGSIAGSSDVTISNAPPNVVGDWALQSIDGKAPPDTVVHTSTITIEFLDGTLALNQDMSYKLLFHSRTTQADSAVSDSSGSSGTYVQSGSTVTIHNATNNGDVVATVTSSTLTFVDGSLTFVFAKSP